MVTGKAVNSLETVFYPSTPNNALVQKRNVSPNSVFCIHMCVSDPDTGLMYSILFDIAEQFDVL